MRRLGVGGMAETFVAVREGPGDFEQRVCLKRVLPAFAEDEGFRRRFAREAQIAAGLRYNNIVGVLDFGEAEGAPYMALELIDGVDLRGFLDGQDERRLDPTVVCFVGLELAFALHHAHDAGVVHRDLSPANVLLSRAGEVKLADFGVATLTANANPTMSGTIRGKVPYMAPEHMRGKKLDGRADLFSLGVLLYECLYGRRPFDGVHDVDTMQRILEGKRHDLPAADVDAPPELVRTIDLLLSIDRDARPATARAVIEGLAPIAPGPRARRELAGAIEAIQGGVETREHVVRATAEDPDTRLASVPMAVAEATGSGAFSLADDVAQGAVGGGAGDTAEAAPPDTMPSTVDTAPVPAVDPAAAEPTPVAPVRTAAAEGKGGADTAPKPRSRSARWWIGAAAGLLAAGLAGAFFSSTPSADTQPPALASPPTEARQANDGSPTQDEEVAVPVPHEDGPRADDGAAPDQDERSELRAANEASPGEPNTSAASETSAGEAPSSTESVDTPGAPAAEPEHDPSAGDSSLAHGMSATDSAGSDRDNPSSSPMRAAAPAEARPARIRIVASPWGDAWVDGRFMGRAPVTAHVSPGTHTVSAGPGRPARSRRVTVRAGQRRRVMFDFEAGGAEMQ